MRSILDDMQQRPRPKGASLREDILANLREVLSTPRHSSRAFMDLGVADVTQVYCEYPDALGPLQQQLLHTIRTYEPRLIDVEVWMIPFDEHDLRLRFDVYGSFVDEDGHLVPTAFRSAIHNDNDVSFR